MTTLIVLAVFGLAGLALLVLALWILANVRRRP